MPRTARLELDLASPEELADAVGVSVLDAVSFSKELVGLADGCDLPFFMASSKSSKASGRDQLLSAALAHPTLEKLLESALLVACEPSLALTPRVAQRLGGPPPSYGIPQTARA